MLLPLEFKHIQSIEFPVFRLNTDEIREEDGLLLLNERVLDDKNQQGKTLGVRRLQTPHKTHTLSRGYMDFCSMLKSSGKYFIDNKGMAFEYVKTQFATVKYHRILSYKGKTFGCLLHCKDCDNTILVSAPPPHWSYYAGILYIGKYPWRLYEYSDEKKSNTRRKI
jgi:hypothetical protein